MIVRVLGEGQFEPTAEETDRITALDGILTEAVASGDEERFARALEALLTEVRRCHRVDPGTFVPSDLAVPAEGSTLADVHALLDQDTPEKA